MIFLCVFDNIFISFAIICAVLWIFWHLFVPVRISSQPFGIYLYSLCVCLHLFEDVLHLFVDMVVFGLLVVCGIFNISLHTLRLVEAGSDKSLTGWAQGKHKPTAQEIPFLLPQWKETSAGRSISASCAGVRKVKEATWCSLPSLLNLF